MLRTETRPTSQQIVRTPDAFGRLDTVTFPGGALDYDYVASNATSGAGKTSSISGPYGVDLGFTYDGFLNTGITWTGDIAGSVGWQYNTRFAKTFETVTGATGTATTAFAYDNDLLLTCASPTTCAPAGSNALILTRSSQHGMVTNISLGNTSEAFTYNTFGELATQVSQYSGTPLVNLTYHAGGAAQRDALGRIVQKTEVIGGASKVFTYEYDNLGRLEDVFIDGILDEHFGYDPNGNRTTHYSASTGLTLSPTYDDQDRLLTYGTWTFTYTANGELETKTDTATSDEWILGYDVLGNLLSVGLPNGDLIEYLVDGAGRSVAKKLNGVVTKQWLYRDALKPVAELDGSGALVAQFVYGSKSNVPDYVRRGGATYRVVSDHLGSPRYVVNVANAADVPFTANYAPFGSVTGTGLDWMPFGFAGGIYDADTGLIRFGARDYDPSVGRWTSKDPIRFRGAQGSLFAYVNSDPLNRTDPTGLAVYLCGRVTEDPRLSWTGEPHEWIYTDSGGAIGMWDCPTNHDNGLHCAFSDVCVTETPWLMYHPDTTCELIQETDETCVNAALTPGTNLGCWNLWNECRIFARNVLSSCGPPPFCNFVGAEGAPNACF